MKTIRLATCAALLALSPLVANADMIVDETTFHAGGTDHSDDYADHGCGDVNFIQSLCFGRDYSGVDFVEWNHIFDLSGLGTLISASLTIWFTDDEGDQSDDRWWKKELGFGYAEDTGWDLDEIDTGSYGPYDVNLLALSDGMFNVRVKSLFGDFYIDRSVLSIEHQAAAVPEPSTLALLGLGLLGVRFARRRKN